MKSNPVVNGVIRGLATMLIGLLLLFVSDSALPLLIQVTGAIFFLPALVSMVNLYISRNETSLVPKVLMTLINVGSMAFGLWLMIVPSTFVELFTTLLAIVLFLFALYQVIVIVAAQRKMAIPMTLLIAPLILIVVAVVVLTASFESDSEISVLFGICAVLAGISDILIALKIKKNISAYSGNASSGGSLFRK